MIVMPDSQLVSLTLLSDQKCGRYYRLSKLNCV